jgi:hypothetical protein
MDTMTDNELEFLGVSEPLRLLPASQSPRSQITDRLHSKIKSLRQSLNNWSSTRTTFQNACSLRQGLGFVQGAILTFAAGATIATIQGKIEAKTGAAVTIGVGGIVYALSRQAERGIEAIEDIAQDEIGLSKERADYLLNVLMHLAGGAGNVVEMKEVIAERLEYGDRCAEVLDTLSGHMCGEPEQIGEVLRRKLG